MIEKNYIYGYNDYINHPEGEKIEIMDGQIYDMCLSPATQHQEISGYLFHKIYNYLQDKAGSVFSAPFDVYLVEENEDINACNNIVQPDISVIFDKNKLITEGCKGSPDFIIEIVDDSSKKHDYITKHYLYSEFLVKEYWIVDPLKKIITVYLAEEDILQNVSRYTFHDTIKVSLLEDLEIDFSQIN